MFAFFYKFFNLNFNFHDIKLYFNFNTFSFMKYDFYKKTILCTNLLIIFIIKLKTQIIVQFDF